jgi:hypothetical protein
MEEEKHKGKNKSTFLALPQDEAMTTTIGIWRTPITSKCEMEEMAQSHTDQSPIF